jgi:hypothetical protein
MRKLAVVALAGILTLAVAAVAIAASGTSGTTVQQYDQKYSQKKVNKSTGTTFSTSSTDEQNSAKNKQPKRVTNFDITFPRGSKIDSKAAPQCKASDSDFANAESPDDACPRGSKIGSGKVAARTPFNGVADFTGTVTAYNANKGLILFVNVQSANQTLVLRPKFRGLRLLTPVPQTCIPPNRPDQDCRPGGTGEPQEAILTNFELKTSPKSSGRGSKRRQMITTPKTCPSGGWTFEADIKYADGTSTNIPTKSPCSR